MKSGTSWLRITHCLFRNPYPCTFNAMSHECSECQRPIELKGLEARAVPVLWGFIRETARRGRRTSYGENSHWHSNHPFRKNRLTVREFVRVTNRVLSSGYERMTLMPPTMPSTGGRTPKYCSVEPSSSTNPPTGPNTPRSPPGSTTWLCDLYDTNRLQDAELLFLPSPRY